MIASAHLGRKSGGFGVLLPFLEAALAEAVAAILVSSLFALGAYLLAAPKAV